MGKEGALQAYTVHILNYCCGMSLSMIGRCWIALTEMSTARSAIAQGLYRERGGTCLIIQGMLYACDRQIKYRQERSLIGSASEVRCAVGHPEPAIAFPED